MRTTTLILGLIAATLFLMSGACATACGTVVAGVDEAMAELDGSSTSADDSEVSEEAQ